MTNKTTSRVAVGAIGTLAATAAFLGYSLFSDSSGQHPKKANQPSELFSAPQTYANTPLQEPVAETIQTQPQTSALEQVIEQAQTAPQPTPELTVEEKLRNYVSTFPLQVVRGDPDSGFRSDEERAALWAYLVNKQDQEWITPPDVAKLYESLLTQTELQERFLEEIFSRLDEDKMFDIACNLFDREKPEYLGEDHVKEQRIRQLAAEYKKRILAENPLERTEGLGLWIFNDQLGKYLFQDGKVKEHLSNLVDQVNDRLDYLESNGEKIGLLRSDLSFNQLRVSHPDSVSSVLYFPRELHSNVYATPFGKHKADFNKWERDFADAGEEQDLPSLPETVLDDCHQMSDRLRSWKKDAQNLIRKYGR